MSMFIDGLSFCSAPLTQLMSRTVGLLSEKKDRTCSRKAALSQTYDVNKVIIRWVFPTTFW